MRDDAPSDQSSAVTDLVSRKTVEENIEWIADWRDDQFHPSYDVKGWPIEMHGVVGAYEELAAAYLQTLTALEQIRRTGHPCTCSLVATRVLGERPSPDTTATEDDGEGELGEREGWEVRLRFTDAHEDEARAILEELLNRPYTLYRAGVRTIWLHELVWLKRPEMELYAISRRFERL